jgi:outer membrane protein OmpA-like peptidoglycan-associated protein
MRAVLSVALLFFTMLTLAPALVRAQSQDSLLEQRRRLAERARVMSSLDSLQLTIQNVTLTSFPEIGLVVECVSNCQVLDTIKPSTLRVVENGVMRPVTRIKKIDVTERVPVDFMFVIDVTGTMQPYINGVRNNIESFVSALSKRGIDYQIGLVLFSDVVEEVFEPTDSIGKFMKWMTKVSAFGGFDEKENALQGMHDASKVNFRPSANKVFVLVTDAGYHQMGERGNGRTRYNTESIIEHLNEMGIRVFCIVPSNLKQYQRLAEGTRGAVFDLDQPFSKILDQYSERLTNLYTIYYRGDSKLRSDSINVALLDERKRELVKQIIPIVEIGRKFIIENLLFETNSAVLADTVEELDVLMDFMKSRPGVRVRVEGHTDSRGSQKGNKFLSLGRAETVKNYLVQRGMDPARISTIGFGSTRPIGDNETEFGRSLNRRTEIVIIAK